MVLGARTTGSSSGVIRIASPDDARIAEYRHLADPGFLVRANLFVAEGRLVVRRLLSHPLFRIRSILVTHTAFEALADVLAGAAADIFVVDQATMNGIAGFNIHRGCLALAERPQPLRLAELPLEAACRIVVLEAVNNPDNIGGIFRSAAAFGVDAVVLGPACSDPLYRKSVRTSMAAALTVPFATAAAWPGDLQLLRERGMRVLALTPAGDATPLDALPRDLRRIALLVGAEGEGLTREAMAYADARVTIPMRPAVNSLNVTVAASIALYYFSLRVTHGA
jgi:tRNA G18 (ribose-2'-O)-methylase SpoU